MYITITALSVLGSLQFVGEYTVHVCNIILAISLEMCINISDDVNRLCFAAAVVKIYYSVFRCIINVLANQLSCYGKSALLFKKEKQSEL